MKNEGLTAKQVEHMKPRETRYEVPAGPPKGLYLVIQSSGTKSWAFRYRWLGDSRKLTFPDPYPKMGLAAARAEAEAKVKELEDGKDPARIQKQEIEIIKLPKEAFKSVVDEYVKREVCIDPENPERSKRENARILNQAVKEWKHRMISDVTKPDVHRFLDSIVDRGASVMACRTRGALLRFFTWAKARGYIESSPMIDVGRPGPDHQSRDRVLTPDELIEILEASGGLGYPLAPFVRLSVLTAQRRGEVATMRWKDIDLDRALWTLPAESTKAGRVHDVPLSNAAVELLKGLPRFTKGDYVFTTTSGKKPINGFSKAKDRIEAALQKNIPSWTMHDFRRTAATHMAGSGVPPHVLSAILNHTPGATQGVTAIYNRFRYTEERRAALEAWANFVASLGKKESLDVRSA